MKENERMACAFIEEQEKLTGPLHIPQSCHNVGIHSLYNTLFSVGMAGICASLSAINVIPIRLWGITNHATKFCAKPFTSYFIHPPRRQTDGVNRNLSLAELITAIHIITDHGNFTTIDQRKNKHSVI